ncbi:MAG TPA: hypothetical protein VEU97_01120 [Ktedonobacteraceae bacterium]|nr:hypothetical protein [Ktedonobacteraceae bacterium]
METTADGTYFGEGDHVYIKRTGETGKVNATAGGVVYVLMDDTNESRIFAAYVDEDASIELVTPMFEELIARKDTRGKSVDTAQQLCDASSTRP